MILSIEPFSSSPNSPTLKRKGHRRIDAAPLRLPLRSDGVLSNERIRCEQHTIVLDGLADQHPIERIAMQGRKFVQVKHRPFFER
jgi:hypothetical protein